MALLNLLPDTIQLELSSLTLDAETGEITALAATKSPEAACPLCQQPSSRVHSYYSRHWADLPCCGQSIHWHVCVRRFRCDNTTCPRKIFAERLACTPAYARRTVRQADVLTALAFALGGHPGARLSAYLSLQVSHDTLIRLIRRQPEPPAASVCILGVDDWSYRRGKRWGTILVNLETSRVVDVLPDRTAPTLTKWLKGHPEVQVISRDRGGEYALGARQGAPQAVQVADRFHVIRNLAEALERSFQRHRKTLKEIHVSTSLLSTLPLTVRYPRPDREQRKQEARTVLVERHEAVHRLLKQGKNLSEIAQILQLNWKTIARYARTESFPERPVSAPRAGILGPYEPYLRARFQEGYRNELGLWREIQAQGFTGSRMTVVRFILGLRHLEQQGMGLPKTAPTTELTPQHLVGLLLQQSSDLTKEEQQAVVQAKCLHPDIQHAAALLDQFLHMVRELRGEELDGWLHASFHSGIPELRSFVVKLRQDQEAVQAGLILSWSNDHVA